MKNLISLLTCIIFTSHVLSQTTGQFNSSISWSNFAGTQNRNITVYVPTNYNSNQQYKLIIGFHGLGDTPTNYIGALIPYCTDTYYGNVIAVALQYSDWDQNLYDDGIVPAAINKIAQDYNLDAANVYLEGFSVGGISSTYRGLKNSTIIKGIITNSGAMAGISDIQNTCTTGACKNYDYSKTNEVVACFTSSPSYEVGICSGAVSPCDAANTFYATNTAASNEFNTYTPGSSIFIDNPNNCHCLPTVSVNYQCWDHVSQVVSLTAPIAAFSANQTTIGQGDAVTFTDNSNQGGASITSWNWSFINGTPSTFNGQTPPAITYNTVGSHQVSLTVTNSFGSDIKTEIGYINVVAIGDAFSLDFELPSDYSLIFPPWENLDSDNKNTYSSSDFDFPGEGAAFGFMAFNPAVAALATPIASTHGGSRCGVAICPSDATAADNWLISDQLLIGANGSFNFWVLSPKPSSWGNETFNVLVSTTGAANSFFPIASNEDAPSTWTQKFYDLSAYEGQQIYVAIQHVSVDKFLFFIDDIQITSDAIPTGIEEKLNKNITIYPNPAKETVTITDVLNSNIEISDINGRIILTNFSNNSNMKLDVNTLSNGTYFIKIYNENFFTVQKLIIE